MKKVITIPGSNSKKSINKRLVEHAGRQLKDVEIINIDLNNFVLPLYSIDLENEEGFPTAAIEFSGLIENSDGIIISLAEHNGAYSAVFKNLFDWLSRINSQVWRQKPMVLLSTSPGIRGGQSVLEIALNRFPRNGGNIIGSMAFPNFNENFVDGKVASPDLSGQLNDLITKLQSEL